MKVRREIADMMRSRHRSGRDHGNDQRVSALPGFKLDELARRIAVLSAGGFVLLLRFGIEKQIGGWRRHVGERWHLAVFGWEGQVLRKTVLRRESVFGWKSILGRESIFGR